MPPEASQSGRTSHFQFYRNHFVAKKAQEINVFLCYFMGSVSSCAWAILCFSQRIIYSSPEHTPGHLPFDFRKLQMSYGGISSCIRESAQWGRKRSAKAPPKRIQMLYLFHKNPQYSFNTITVRYLRILAHRDVEQEDKCQFSEVVVGT